MDRLEGSMNRLETRMDGLEGRMNTLEGRMGRLEDRTDALNVRLNVSVETLDAKLQLVLERIDAHSREMRVWTEAIVNEHRADRRLMYSMLGDHRVRIEALEQDVRSSRGQGPSQEP
jgi:chromosome segregation ATPase